MQLTEGEFTDAIEVIDGKQYLKCKFSNCQLVYRGGQLPSMNGCHFHNCRWQFEDAADRTLVFMRLLYHGMGKHGADMIESAFNTIRTPLE